MDVAFNTLTTTFACYEYVCVRKPDVN